MEQIKLLVKNAGQKDPESLEQYLARGGYEALKSATRGCNGADIIEILSASGLVGRSGSGFPVGKKWAVTLEKEAPQKYVICNADEGEPGTCKDRLLLMEHPHAVIEGIVIAGVTVGATQGYIYIRGEYDAAAHIFAEAVNEARSAGYLGCHICGSGYDFQLEIRRGAGAYMCGEETALLESIEGRRGETRIKPPYPGEAGLWGMPTVINNVETMANIPLVLTMGAEKYRTCGTESSTGTKLVTLCGCIRNPGVYEVPFGTSIRSLFLDIGGGCPEGKKLRAVQTGGLSGPIMSVDVLDTPFDIAGCNAAGAFLGTGDLIFIDEATDLAGLLVNIMEFFMEESCGRCVPCRIGIHTLVELLRALASGPADMDTLNQIESIALHIRQTARCAFGTAAVTPVLSALKSFYDLLTSCVEKEVV